MEGWGWAVVPATSQGVASGTGPSLGTWAYPSMPFWKRSPLSWDVVTLGMQGGICQVGLVPGFKSGDQLEMALGAEVAGGAGPRGQTQGEWYGSESSSGVVVPYSGMQGTWGHRCRVPPHEST